MLHYKCRVMLGPRCDDKPASGDGAQHRSMEVEIKTTNIVEILSFSAILQRLQLCLNVHRKKRSGLSPGIMGYLVSIW
ncbi:hypothetical protein GQ457_05G019170 [Hibiscus cannabinus]